MCDQGNVAIRFEEGGNIRFSENVREYAHPESITRIDSMDEEKEALKCSVGLFRHLNGITFQCFGCLLLKCVGLVSSDGKR